MPVTQRFRPRLVAIITVALALASGLSLSTQAQDSATEFTSSPSPSIEPASTPAASPVPGELDTDATASPAPVTVTVEAGDVWFSPTEISIEARQGTVLALTGVGLAAHNLIIDELGLQLHVGPGITSEVDVSELPPGTYAFYCSIYGHARAGMVGTLTVESPSATESPAPVA